MSRAALERGLAAVCVVALVLGSPSRAWSLGADATPPPPTPAASPDSAARLGEAFERFNEGVRLYEARQFPEALAEFERAYQLVPHYQVLFNIGRANFQLGQFARARQSLELYLELGAGLLPEQRVAQVQADLALLRAKTARLSLSTNVPDASIVIDAVRLEPTKWTDIVVEPGAHVLYVSKEGYTSVERSLRLGQGDDVHVVVQLMPLTTPSVPPPAPVPREPIERSVTWVPWAVTGVLAAGWLTATALAVQAQADKDDLEDPRTSPERLDGAVARLKTLAILSDVLLASTLGAAGISAYVTWAPESSPREAREHSPAVLGGAVWAFGVRGDL